MEEIIKLENINVKIKGRTIFSDLNLELKKPGVYGFVGPNGTGKSVLFKIISGIYKPNNGYVYIRGLKLGDKGIDFAPKLGILVDSPGFVGIYTGLKNLQYLAQIQNKIKDQNIKDWMEYFGLSPLDKTLVKNYSLGMKQKLGIIQAVMENQDLVIFDEPFNALDKKSMQKAKDLIYKLKLENKTILLTSHNQMDLDELCDKIYLIENLKLYEE